MEEMESINLYARMKCHSPPRAAPFTDVRRLRSVEALRLLLLWDSSQWQQLKLVRALRNWHGCHSIQRQHTLTAAQQTVNLIHCDAAIDVFH